MPTVDVTIRPYADGDGDAIARTHDAARLDELRDPVGVETFLTLAQTAEGEGLFDGRLWVAEDNGAVAAAGPRAEVTVLDGNPAAVALYLSEGFTITETRTGSLAGNEAFAATGHIMHRTPR